MALKFLPFRREFYDEYASWFSDPELNRHLGPMDNDWLEAVLSESGTVGITWAVFRDAELVGVVEVKYPPANQLPVAILAVAVKPALRGHGIGSEIVRELLSRDHTKGLLEHVGYVSPENPRAQRFLETLGLSASVLTRAGACILSFGIAGNRASDEAVARLTQPRRAVVSACPDFP